MQEWRQQSEIVWKQVMRTTVAKCKIQKTQYQNS